MNDLCIFERDGNALVNSRDMARIFGKQHRNVMRDIDAILGRSDLSGLKKQWFIERWVWDDLANKQIRTFDMTRQGFSLLAFGYTGPKAMTFKVRYIQEFDRMEAELTRLGQIDNAALLERIKLLESQRATQTAETVTISAIHSTASQLVKDVHYGGKKWQRFRKTAIPMLSAELRNKLGHVSKPGGHHGPWEFPRHLALPIAQDKVPGWAKVWAAKNDPPPTNAASSSANVLPLLEWAANRAENP